jgi:hypothetical protein
MKMAVFWVVVLCSLVISEVLAASIKVMTHTHHLESLSLNHLAPVFYFG